MLTVTNLSVRCGEFPAVAGISFNVSRGEFVSILGPSSPSLEWPCGWRVRMARNG
jgi:ABC-type sugar transport system ATPase subunit